MFQGSFFTNLLFTKKGSDNIDRENIRSNQKALTLVELVITLAIISFLTLIIIQVFAMNNAMANNQLKESAQRHEIRAAAAYLTEDIKFSKAINFDIAKPNELIITDKDDQSIIYYIAADAEGNNYLKRQAATETEFKEIKDVSFSLDNSTLVSAKLITDIANNKFNEFKITSLGTQVALSLPVELTPEEKFRQFVLNESVFIYGSELTFAGNECVFEEGTIFVTDDFSGRINGGAKIKVKHLYTNGDLAVSQGHTLGLVDESNIIFINGTLTFDGGAKMYGDVNVNENLVMNNGTINGNVNVAGNATLSGNPTINGDINV
ncbi:MAG TPA: prepilin-type N-terminal cleavage/methylation domain-containing protein, partial [Clostridiales bacterium]|nr:prepilin-type N-terminal cleavage/methylation domain-containing protein [Clostridiales bacterium]